MATSLQERFRQATRRELEGTRGTSEEIRGFDPREAMRESARGAFETLQSDFGRQLRDLRGSQVSAGRLRTGFGTQDEDRLMEDFNSRLARALATRAQAAAGQRLQQFGLQSRNRGRALDLLAGGLDRQVARRNAEAQEKSAVIGGIAKLGAAAIPFL